MYLTFLFSHKYETINIGNWKLSLLVVKIVIEIPVQSALKLFYK